MSLNIKNEQTHRLARELAKLTGENVTAAVTIALQERLERVRRDKQIGLRAAPRCWSSTATPETARSAPPLAAALNKIGLAVQLFDYRGYGGNPGTPSELGLQADARTTRAYLRP